MELKLRNSIFTLRLPPDLKDKLTKEAAMFRISLNQYIVMKLDGTRILLDSEQQLSKTGS